jgi:DNA invertase Pin-like site-specific DNA recombinase
MFRERNKRLFPDTNRILVRWTLRSVRCPSRHLQTRRFCTTIVSIVFARPSGVLRGTPVCTETTFVPAAQYVRASTERQQYSIAYQAAVIAEYAAEHGFEVVRTFSDEARSGLDLRYRPALRQLLAEVVAGEAAFRVILVFDVSRWGRFQDTDEAAHYEYVCKSAGIPIHYCAEPFSSVGGISDSLLKALKRFMAGEFSRDLSARASGGLNNIVQRGYKYGSVPGYGLRRALVGRDGAYKQQLAPGELKNISSDRVVLVPGPPEEQVVVREIYQKFVEERQTIRQITKLC